MADVFTKRQRSRIMAKVASQGTKAEVLLRRMIRKERIGFCMNAQDMPGRPDIVMRKRRRVVFVHGCFWHGHHCRRGARLPKTNAAYWREKMRRNRARDASTRRKLRRMGWRVLVIWACQTPIRKRAALMRRLSAFLSEP